MNDRRWNSVGCILLLSVLVSQAPGQSDYFSQRSLPSRVPAATLPPSLPSATYRAPARRYDSPSASQGYSPSAPPSCSGNCSIPQDFVPQTTSPTAPVGSMLRQHPSVPASSPLTGRPQPSTSQWRARTQPAAPAAAQTSYRLIPSSTIENRNVISRSPARQVDATDGLTLEEQVNIAVYEKSNRSVVHITTEFDRPTRSRISQDPGRGSGSGSVIDQQGFVLTNYHVIEDARVAQVTLFDGSSYNAILVGADPANDVAILRIDAPAELLYPIPTGHSSGLRVGQKVYAIGNPFGLSRTLTVGILSSVHRSIPSRSGEPIDVLQLDAALNRGNSGGPLLDSRGQLIGMNTAIASPSGRGENTGIGFAIPVDTLWRIVPKLMRTAAYQPAQASITPASITPARISPARISPASDQPHGLSFATTPIHQRQR